VQNVIAYNNGNLKFWPW